MVKLSNSLGRSVYFVRMALVLVLLGKAALASFIYDFSFTPTVGSIHAVSFEFTSTNLIMTGPLSFAPFDVNESAHIQTISKGAAGVINVGGTDIRCFVFGTADTELEPPCGIGSNNPPLSLFLAFNFTPIPAAAMNGPGSFTTANDQFLVWAGTDPDFPNSAFGRGNITLTISAVPEAASANLAFMGLTFLAVLVVRSRLYIP